ncbi:hypothetical protein CN370_33075, partial [Bacillus cereus]
YILDIKTIFMHISYKYDLTDYSYFQRRHISDNLCLFLIGVSKFVCKFVSTFFIKIAVKLKNKNSQ